MGLGLSAAAIMYRRRRKNLSNAEVLIIEGFREIKTDLFRDVDVRFALNGVVFPLE